MMIVDANALNVGVIMQLALAAHMFCAT